MTTVGICTGLLFHAAMSALGLSVILHESARPYSLVKMAGAFYLIYLGFKSLYGVLKGTSTSFTKVTGEKINSSLAFRQGLLTNILNPKVAVFYLTFLPQFVDQTRNVFIQSISLAGIHIAMSFVWLSAIEKFVTFFRSQLTKTQVKHSLEAITGMALLYFGIKLARME